MFTGGRFEDDFRGMRMTGGSRAIAVVAACLAIAAASLGCGDGRRYETRLAVIDTGVPEDLHVTVPDTVRAGEPVDVHIRTYGGGCLVRDPGRRGRTSVHAEGPRIRLEPFDVFDLGPSSLQGGWSCTDVLSYWTRTVPVRFDEPGNAVVVVRGLSWSTTPAATIEVERTVVVR